MSKTTQTLSPVNIGKRGGGGGGYLGSILILAVFTALLALLPTATGQIWIDGEQVNGEVDMTQWPSWISETYSSTRDADHVVVSAVGVYGELGYINNGGNIDSVDLSSTDNSWSWLTNRTWDEDGPYGSINTVNFSGSKSGGNGSVMNEYGGYIGTVNAVVSLPNFEVANYGTIDTINGGGYDGMGWGYVSTLNADSFGFSRNHDNATIGTANLYAGNLENYGNATINTINLYRSEYIWTSPTVYNQGNATIGSLFLDIGTLAYNSGNATIDSLFLNGGFVSNTALINNLTYSSGNYSGPGGTIGTLTLAGDSTGIDWGNVENLVFASNGNGILSIAAFVEEMPMTRALPNISFSGINAQNIDFTNGNIAMDLSALGSNGDAFFGLFDDGFSLASLFGGADIEGVEGLNSFYFALGDDFGWGEELFTFLSDGELGDVGEGWTQTDVGLVWGTLPSAGSVPEPATLAIVALGLAGLGLARRRRK